MTAIPISGTIADLNDLPAAQCQPVTAVTVSELLDAAARVLSGNPDLPQPGLVTVSDGSRQVRFQFITGAARDDLATLAAWAGRYGGTIVAAPVTRSSDGSQRISCNVQWTADGVAIYAYTHVTPEVQETT